MKKLAIAALGITALIAESAMAGSPHFVEVDASVSGNSLTVTGKEAGLGNEDQVNIVVTAQAACVNPGSNKPKAANKQTFAAEGTFPVQNGKANFTLTLTATFQPNCSPPMTVVWGPTVSVTDMTSGISTTLRI